jgi:hypothetical protein
MMEWPIIDIGFSMNVFKSTVCAYGFWLFSWWGNREWKRKKQKPSEVYSCITLMLLGLAIDNAVEAYARQMWISYGIDEIRKTIWWPLRLVVSTFAIVLMVGSLTMRAKKAILEEKSNELD